MRITKTTKSLECILTDVEKLAYGKQMAMLLNEKARVEGSLKAVQSQMNGEIETCVAQVNVISQKVASGKEYRDVQCSIEYDWDKKLKAIWRNDTCELVDTDIISEAELQEEMELNAPKKPKSTDEPVFLESDQPELPADFPDASMPIDAQDIAGQEGAAV